MRVLISVGNSLNLRCGARSDLTFGRCSLGGIIIYLVFELMDDESGCERFEGSGLGMPLGSLVSTFVVVKLRC